VKNALKPIDAMVESAERITSRNLGQRLPNTASSEEFARLSDSLNQMIVRLENAFQQSSRFSADASHELRTPLAILRGELEGVVRRPNLPTGVEETVNSALEETDRLAKITENLLAISRLEADDVELDRTRFDLSELAAATANQMRPIAEDKGIELLVSHIPSVFVEGSAARLNQVIVNLIDNAIRYTPEGGEISVMVAESEGRAVLKVADNGIGVPEDCQEKIFERFYRVDKSSLRKPTGSGLGLSIVKSICKAHGGDVSVKSTNGIGSRFIVTLPLAAKAPINGLFDPNHLSDSQH